MKKCLIWAVAMIGMMASVYAAEWAVYDMALNETEINEFGGKDEETPVIEKEKEKALLVINKDRSFDENAVFIIIEKGEHVTLSAEGDIDEYIAKDKEDKHENITAESGPVAGEISIDQFGDAIFIGNFKWSGKYDKEGEELVSEKYSASLSGAGLDEDDDAYLTGKAKFNSKLSTAMNKAEDDDAAFDALVSEVAKRTKQTVEDVKDDVYLRDVFDDAAGDEIL
jgi:hypothetical protein